MDDGYMASYCYNHHVGLTCEEFKRGWLVDVSCERTLKGLHVQNRLVAVIVGRRKLSSLGTKREGSNVGGYGQAYDLSRPTKLETKVMSVHNS